jgi:mRNA interferase MazF
MNRGDIWLINLGGRIGSRPVVVLTRQNVLDYLNKVTAAEITTQGKGYPTEIFVGPKANLSKPSFVQADNIHTVSKNRLEKFLGTLDKDSMLEISRKIVLALELESCPYES